MSGCFYGMSNIIGLSYAENRIVSHYINLKMYLHNHFKQVNPLNLVAISMF